jgi:BirA family transcriptional regulator, biotin operon repressor / biotin---[acetyl-CoA-carboxylase] ligase
MTFDPAILRFDSIDSTNLEAMRQAKAGAPEGLCIIARVQTHGRGRQGRSWVSEKDAGLHFTALLRPSIDMSNWPLITLMSALAVADTLRNACKVNADIKWPNDLIVNQQKVAGILCETVDAGPDYAVVVGIGINLYHGSYPETVRSPASSIEQESGSRPNFENVLGELIDCLARRYNVLQGKDGKEQTLREWLARSSYGKGKHVRVDTGAEVLLGITDGLEDDGALRVILEDGELRVIRAGDVQSVRASER